MKNNQEGKTNAIEWFRNFAQTCSDDTIAMLIFLYDKYGKVSSDDEESMNFIKQLASEYKKPKIVGSSNNKPTLTYLNFRCNEDEQTCMEYPVVIYKNLSKDELDQIEDAISSYIDEDDEWQIDTLIEDVMNSFDFKWELLKVEKNFNI